jgi:hypothetical protein
MLFVPERRRSLRVSRRDPRPRCSRRRSAGGADEMPPRTGLIFLHVGFVGSDEDGGYPANIAASGASQKTQRAWRARQSNCACKGELVAAGHLARYGRHLQVVSVAEYVVAVQADTAEIAVALFIPTGRINRFGSRLGQCHL